MLESYRQVLEHLSVAVLWFDHAMRLRIANSAAEALFGLSFKQMRKLPGKLLFPTVEDFISSIQLAVRENSPVTKHGVTMNLPDAREITVDYTVTPTRGAVENAGVLLELRQVDQALRFSREQHMLMQQEAVFNIMRGLAHEIKNPLGGLRGTAQLLARELPEENLREYTSIIIREADRLQSLLDRMLGPRKPLRRGLVNVHIVLAQVKQLILSEYPAHLRIINDFDPSLPDVYADSDQLHQIFLNIIRNAAQVMRGEGEITLITRIQRHVLLGRSQRRLAVRTDVCDQGPGVPEDMQEQIFYPLFTTRTEGTGLGLAIAQNLAKYNGGLISCRNNSSGQGAIFSLLLPVEQDCHA